MISSNAMQRRLDWLLLTGLRGSSAFASPPLCSGLAAGEAVTGRSLALSSLSLPQGSLAALGDTSSTTPTSEAPMSRATECLTSPAFMAALRLDCDWSRQGRVVSLDSRICV